MNDTSTKDMIDILASLVAFSGGLASFIGSFKLLKMKDELVKIKKSENDFLKLKNQDLKDKLHEKGEEENERIRFMQDKIDLLLSAGFDEQNILKKFSDCFKEDIDRYKNKIGMELQENEKRLREENEAKKIEYLQSENQKLHKNIEWLTNFQKSALQELDKQLHKDIQAAEWLDNNSDKFAKSASEFALNKTDKEFQNTINQYLDWIIFSLRKGMLIPLDKTPLKPLSSLDKTHKIAFEYIEKKVPEDMQHLRLLLYNLISSIK